ncbi:MAG TPA: preprotein translocase subunit SecE [Candidatus Saccharimonadales bacterium]
MADSKSSKTTKRRLRAPAQTVREQAQKAQEQAEKPEGKRRLRQAAAKTSKPIGRLGQLFNYQPLRAIRAVFRFIGRILVPRFVRNSFAELKLVTWPNRKKTRDLTFAVLMFAIVFGILVTIIDYGLDKLFKALILNS